MKKCITSLLLIILSISFATAQSEWSRHHIKAHFKKDMSIGMGFNIVDDSGTRFGALLSIKENWNFGRIPLAVNFEYYVSSSFSLLTKLSINKYKKGKDINDGIVLKDNEANFFAADFVGKYSFLEILNVDRLEPYLSLGIGYTRIGAYKIEGSPSERAALEKVDLNAGFGISYWLSNRWAINVDLMGKWGGAEDYKQYSFGMIYDFPKRGIASGFIDF